MFQTKIFQPINIFSRAASELLAVAPAGQPLSHSSRQCCIRRCALSDPLSVALRLRPMLPVLPPRSHSPPSPLPSHQPRPLSTASSMSDDAADDQRTPHAHDSAHDNDNDNGGGGGGGGSGSDDRANGDAADVPTGGVSIKLALVRALIEHEWRKDEMARGVPTGTTPDVTRQLRTAAAATGERQEATTLAAAVAAVAAAAAEDVAVATDDGSSSRSLSPPPCCCPRAHLRSVRNDAVEVIGEYMRLLVVGQLAQPGQPQPQPQTLCSRSAQCSPPVLSSLSLPVLRLCRGRSSLRGRFGGRHDHATRSAATLPRAHQRLLTRRHRAAAIALLGHPASAAERAGSL